MQGAAVLLAKEGGGDVAAAGEKQMGCGCRFLGIQCGKKGNIQSLQGVFIVFDIFGAARDGDKGERGHGLLLWGRVLLYFMRAAAGGSECGGLSAGVLSCRGSVVFRHIYLH